MTAIGVAEQTRAGVWPQWQRILFRFFFIYLLVQIAPWNWLRPIPGVTFFTRYYRMLVDWAVYGSNARFFHVRETLVPLNGSGDTSYAWTQLWLYLSLAAIGCVVWSVWDRRRANYERLLYWLRTIVRYYIAVFALSYGIIKLFALQMPFPSLSQLSTPLGDLLPMRLSWLFLGYSTPYQIFSGAMETVAGLLLLNRRTVTLGLLAATGAFLNVLMINLSYDVPVKLFAAHLLFACLFLLALDAKRLFSFLILNRAAPGTTAYEPNFQKPWQRYTGMAVKALMVVLILIIPLRDGWARYKNTKRPPVPSPFKAGIYDVKRYVVNRDTIPPSASDTVRWKDVIFDNNMSGSVNTTDSMFWQRYRRGYFRYKPDTARRMVTFWRTSFAQDSTHLFTMRYEVPDSSTIRLWTTIRGDSVYLELARTNRHFQLTERQFHWVSEWNR